jgi:hypothetical protein
VDEGWDDLPTCPGLAAGGETVMVEVIAKRLRGVIEQQLIAIFRLIPEI